MCLTYLYIYIYIYICIAFSIELRLRVSRSLRSLANYMCSYSTLMASELVQHYYELCTSMYSPHSGAIGLSKSKQPRALLHFTNGHLFCYSFFLTASVPQKKKDIFITLSMAQQCLLTCKREPTGRKNLCLVLPMLC